MIKFSFISIILVSSNYKIIQKSYDCGNTHSSGKNIDRSSLSFKFTKTRGFSKLGNGTSKIKWFKYLKKREIF